MENLKDIRTGRHCVFLLHVHLVFVTKYRRKAFTKEVIDFMKPIFEKVCKDFEAELKKMAETYKMELDQIKEFMGDYEKKQIKEDLAIQKAIEVITRSVVEK